MCSSGGRIIAPRGVATAESGDACCFVVVAVVVAAPAQAAAATIVVAGVVGLFGVDKPGGADRVDAAVPGLLTNGELGIAAVRVVPAFAVAGRLNGDDGVVFGVEGNVPNGREALGL